MTANEQKFTFRGWAISVVRSLTKGRIMHQCKKRKRKKSVILATSVNRKVSKTLNSKIIILSI